MKNESKFPFLAPKWRQNHYWRKWRQKRVFAEFHDFWRKSSHSKKNWRHLNGAIVFFICEFKKYGISAFTGKKKIMSISLLDNFLMQNEIAHGLLIFSWKSSFFENALKSQFFLRFQVLHTTHLNVTKKVCNASVDHPKLSSER